MRTRKELGKALKEHRVRVGLSKNRVYALMCAGGTVLTRGIVSDVEEGRTNYGVEVLLRYCQAVGVDLLTGGASAELRSGPDKDDEPIV